MDVDLLIFGLFLFSLVRRRFVPNFVIEQNSVLKRVVLLEFSIGATRLLHCAFDLIMTRGLFLRDGATGNLTTNIRLSIGTIALRLPL